MRRRRFQDELPDLSGPAVWLKGNGVKSAIIADVLELTPNHVAQHLRRARLGYSRKRELPLLSALDYRLNQAADEGFLQLNSFTKTGSRATKRLLAHEQKIQGLEQIWPSLTRNLVGTLVLGTALRELSEPAWDNLPLLRMTARVYSMEALTYLQAGYATSALDFGLKAYGTWDAIYRQSNNVFDLDLLGQSTLSIASAYLSRRDIEHSRRWLNIAKVAFDRTARLRKGQPNPEYLRQVASIARHSGNSLEARHLLISAGNALADTRADMTEAALSDMTTRVLNVISPKPDWDNACVTLEKALAGWPSWDWHPASNVAYTAVTGLRTDSPDIRRDALTLVHKHRATAEGLGLQRTALWLLSRTPRVPKGLRSRWALYAISYNAYALK